MSKLGNNIKNLREYFNMTIKELSDKSSVGQSTISELETGKANNPKSETISKISKAFDIPIDSLYQDDTVAVLGGYITDGVLQKWHKEYDSDQIKKEVAFYETGEFTDTETALKFILKQPAFMAYGGYDLNQLSDDEILEIANDMLFAMKLSIEKLKRKK